MNETSAIGIVLQVQPYGERAQIATLWTSELGRIGLYADRSNLKNGGGVAILTPLNEVEVVISRRHGGLWRCHEIRLRRDFRELRGDLAMLKAAGALLQAVLRSQQQEKPAPLLYLLFIDYLKRLIEGISPSVINASFYLKLLRHEGLWNDKVSCSACGVSTFPFYLTGGDFWCDTHAFENSISFETSEWQNLLLLNHCRTVQELAVITCNEQLLSKVTALFTAFFI